MKTQLIILIIVLSSFGLSAQRFDLGSYLNPATSEFELLGISSKTGVSTYKYKKEITDRFFNRKIGDIIVGVRDGIIVSTIYNLIPNAGDVGVPADIIQLIQANIPYPFGNVNGVYGLNIDNETISIARVRNTLTFNQDRIMFLNSVKQSILENTKK
jgi:hypothetical protein